MPKWVYGYAWKTSDGAVHKRYIYANSQTDADEQFEKDTGMPHDKVLDTRVVKRSRHRA